MDIEPGAHVRVKGWKGIAFYVVGPETAPDEDTEWSGYKTPTGKVIVVMVGDDRKHAVDPEDCTPIASEDFCGECGQMGCGHGRV